MSQIIAWRVLWDSTTKTELRKAATDERQRNHWKNWTSAWRDYFVNEIVLLNIYFTQAQSQVQLVFIIFELFSVNRRNQLENYTVVWSKIISFVLFEINCISVARARFFVSLSGQVSDYRRWGLQAPAVYVQDSNWVCLSKWRVATAATN